MKKIFYSYVLGLIILSFKPPQNEVYICGPKGSNRYHYKQKCRSLTQCDHKIYAVNKTEAINYGLTLCKWED